MRGGGKALNATRNKSEKEKDKKSATKVRKRQIRKTEREQRPSHKCCASQVLSPLCRAGWRSASEHGRTPEESTNRSMGKQRRTKEEASADSTAGGNLLLDPNRWGGSITFFVIKSHVCKVAQSPAVTCDREERRSRR